MHVAAALPNVIVLASVGACGGEQELMINGEQTIPYIVINKGPECPRMSERYLLKSQHS